VAGAEGRERRESPDRAGRHRKFRWRLLGCRGVQPRDLCTWRSRRGRFRAVASESRLSALGATHQDATW